MTGNAAALLGGAVRVGPGSHGRVTGVLVDENQLPVLLRVRVSVGGNLVYVPLAVLDDPEAGGPATCAHPVLLQDDEAQFYERHGGKWLSVDDVSAGA